MAETKTTRRLERIEVRPAEGRRVRDPLTGLPLPDDQWTNVAATFYMLKRVRDGDVTVRGPRSSPTSSRRRPAPAPPATPEPPAEEG